MKRNLILLTLITLVFTLVGCKNVRTIESTVKETENVIILGDIKTNEITTSENQKTSYDFRPTTQKFKACDNFDDMLGDTYFVTEYLKGNTKSDYLYATDAFAIDPTYGYTFATKSSNQLRNIDIQIDETYTGVVTELYGRLTGVDEEKYIWKCVDTEQTEQEVLEGRISGFTVYISYKDSNRKTQYLSYENCPFSRELQKTEDGSGYEFNIKFLEKDVVTNIEYITIVFSLVAEDASLRTFTLTNLELRNK